MSEIEKLIVSEQEKIALLKAKIEAAEKRITVLQSFQSEDAIDAAVGAAIASKPEESHEIPEFLSSILSLSTNQSPAAGEYKSPTRSLGVVGMEIMRILSTGGKTLNEIMVALKAKGREPTTHNVRIILRAYKDQYGFFESPRRSFHQITPLGMKYIESQKGEGVAMTSSNAFGHQPVSSTAH